MPGQLSLLRLAYVFKRVDMQNSPHFGIFDPLKFYSSNLSTSVTYFQYFLKLNRETKHLQ